MFNNFSGIDFLRVARETALRFGVGAGIFGDNGIDAIRNINWGTRYLWAVRFIEPACPEPFGNRWFPATDITIGDSSISSYNFEYDQNSYRIPQKTNDKTLSLTFFDTKEAVLQRWFSDWMAIDILNNNKFMSCLLDDHKVEAIGNTARRIQFPESNRVWPVRKIEYFKLDADLEPIIDTIKVLTIYPDTEIQLSGGSDSSAQTFDLSFAIVGEFKRGSDVNENEGNKDSKNEYIERTKVQGARLLGRFI